MNYPRGFTAAGWNAGIKDDSPDFGVVFSETPAQAAAIFTRNNFPGNPVIVGKEHIRGGVLQAVVVNSKNSNVATGAAGLALARNMCTWSAAALGIEPSYVLPSSTGVIGRLPSADKLEAACKSVREKLAGPDFPAFAKAILTTDNHTKVESRELRSGARLIIVAKGAGMIAPNMATMLVYAFTDADIRAADLDRILRAAADRSLNRITVDSDTSTSDTFAVLANGLSGVKIRFPAAAKAFLDARSEFLPPLELVPELDAASLEFFSAFLDASGKIAQAVVADGEGSTKILEVRITEARTKEQALKIARSIADSPLIKTALHGADPNWGRIVMAVGKVFDEPVPFDGMRVFFGDQELNKSDTSGLDRFAAYLKGTYVLLHISLGLGSAEERMWGCDLSREYIAINADYTT